MHGAYEDEQAVHIVMELCTGGELWARIKVGAGTQLLAVQHSGAAAGIACDGACARTYVITCMHMARG